MRAALCGSASRQDRQRLLGRECIREIAEIDLRDDLLGRHVGDESPHGLARMACGQVPRGVDDRADRHVHHALFGAEPAQLRIAVEFARERAEVAGDAFDRAAHHEVFQRGERGRLHIIAPADRKDEAVAREAIGAIGADRHIGRRVVGVRVHRIGTVVVP
jgi:hypothetical protein